MDSRSPIFWIALAFVELLFGVTVFAATRYYYLSQGSVATVVPASTGTPAPAWPGSGAGASPAPAERFMTALPTQDPAEIGRQADELFASRDYDRAAELYARLLELAPNDAEIYNNLGLTLQYLGRSSEALERLAEGVAIDPTHQRIWLTTGFVYAQTGAVADARLALNNAVSLGPETEVGRAAADMLSQLPQ